MESADGADGASSLLALLAASSASASDGVAVPWVGGEGEQSLRCLDPTHGEGCSRCVGRWVARGSTWQGPIYPRTRTHAPHAPAQLCRRAPARRGVSLRAGGRSGAQERCADWLRAVPSPFGARAATRTARLPVAPRPAPPAPPAAAPRCGCARAQPGAPAGLLRDRAGAARSFLTLAFPSAAQAKSC